MPSKTIDTPAEQSLSDRRRGARTVRAAINKQIEELKEFYAINGVGDYKYALEALRKVEEYIDSMIARDKKRKGGLWR